MGTLHGKPAVIIGDIVIACGAECGFAFRAFDKSTRMPVPLDGVTATMTITGLEKTLIAELVGTVEENRATFYLMVESGQVPDMGEYVVDLDPQTFSQPRFAQGLVRFDKTAQEAVS